MECSIISRPNGFLWRLGLPLLLSTLSALFSATALEAQPTGGFTPQWKSGAAWVIQTQYELFQIRAQPEPTATLRWRFQVVRETPRAFTIEARCAEQNAWTRLVVDKPTMSVVSAEFHSTALGREQVMRAKYSGKGMVPHVAAVGAAPLQIPLFPLGVEPETRYHRGVVAGEQTHEVVITQLVEQVTDPGRVREFLEERVGTSAVIPESRRYYIVTSVEGNAKIEQVWAEGLPWFLYSRTPASTSSWVGR
jgi:hypothetical protein